MVAGRDGLSRSLPSIDVATPKVRADQKVVYNPDDPDAMRVWLVHVQGLLDDKDLLHVAKYGVLSFADWSTSHTTTTSTSRTHRKNLDRVRAEL